ncbi:MAG: tRNA (N6-isopentenyl adenosine(37)-C2)-methylthiotransferase MiaB [Bacillota bacterium]|nr:tRNA (N6-isopentenyl adenosine(37)-C2)-methylthiotransferase MiaB [Bacillota bacterium]
MNERDSETLAGFMEELGFTYEEDKLEAQVVVLNTCSVRENADQHFFGVLGQLKHSHEENPGKFVAVCGCMMQQQHIIDAVKKKYPWVNLVFGTHNIQEFPKLFKNAVEEHKRIVDVWEGSDTIAEGLPAKRLYNFKAYVSIMQGCNNFCSYCIVPYTRGRERSRKPEEIIKEITCLAKNGCKEVMLLGQNVNSYNGGISFAQLLREVDKIEGIERIRFMSSHPKDLSDELIDCFKDCKHLCHCFHLPVQSGSNAVLEKMNRRYTREKYFERVEALKAVCPDIAITTDIIVGFPGETEEDFEDTLDLVRRVRYDSAFTFIYSIRKGTPAAEWDNQVPEEVKHERFNRLIDVIHDIQEEQMKEYQDKVLPVLIEGTSKTNANMLTGRTETLKTVDLPGDISLVGKIVPVKIVKAQTFSLYGEIVDA